MRKITAYIAQSFFLLIACASARAHHSVALTFTEEIITIQGTISSVKWVNPHSSFVLEVENEDGTTERWLVELLARIALQRSGFDFDSLQEGTEITVTGRNGRREGNIFFLEGTLADGTPVTWRSPLATDED